MKMIDDYLNSLESFLPDDLKQEVRDELEASIYAQLEDECAELGRELDQHEQETLLRKIGHPMRVAAAYLPNQELVGNEYFPAYKRSLQMALSIALVVNLLAASSELLTGGHVLRSVFGVLGNLIQVGLWIFAVVTLIFHLLQKYGVGLAEIYAWSPKDLKAHKAGRSLSRLETFFEMVVEILFLAWWLNLMNWPASSVGSDRVGLDVSMSPEWTAVFWTVNMIVGSSIFLNVYKLIIAGWDRFSLTANLAINAATLVVLIQISRFENHVIISGSGDVAAQLARAMTVENNVILSVLAGVALYVIWESYCNLKELRKAAPLAPA